MPTPSPVETPVPKTKRLTKAMRAYAIERFVEFRHTIWLKADEIEMGMMPLYVFFPDTLMARLLDQFALIHTIEQLTKLILPCFLLSPHASDLWKLFETLRIELPTLRKTRPKKSNSTAEASAGEAATAASREPSTSSATTSLDALRPPSAPLPRGVSGHGIQERSPATAACASSSRPPESTPSRVDNPVPKTKRLTKVMRAHAMGRFVTFRHTLWRLADEDTMGMMPLYAFFPDTLMLFEALHVELPRLRKTRAEKSNPTADASPADEAASTPEPLIA
ncbi:hypothetical protein FA95DRAFT_1564853 [Auriscalpium vulgare]|uniref:Uncharacterized protein n=1 Tax=Auriscalpium vulgare TaxID=40419 RepID=A0ACB8RCP8_9AGAM|nr:hypothetical protein FA95DRAFT_1564853 [Auriscalpium vulgare]